jgi:hypothetical protein
MLQMRPNCGGGFSPRPPRVASLLAKYPASNERVLRPDGCARAAQCAQPPSGCPMRRSVASSGRATSAPVRIRLML